MSKASSRTECQFSESTAPSSSDLSPADITSPQSPSECPRQEIPISTEDICSSLSTPNSPQTTQLATPNSPHSLVDFSECTQLAKSLCTELNRGESLGSQTTLQGNLDLQNVENTELLTGQEDVVELNNVPQDGIEHQNEEELPSVDELRRQLLDSVKEEVLALWAVGWYK